VNQLFKQNSIGKTAFAFLLAVLIVFLSIAGSSLSLHKLIHPDAREAGHSCVITLFAKSQFSPAPEAAIFIGMALLFGGFVVLALAILLPAADYRFSSSRAPPCFSFSPVG
jgi:hypothetical protein